MSANAANNRYLRNQWVLVLVGLVVIAGLWLKDLNRGELGTIIAPGVFILLLGGCLTWAVIVPKRRLVKALQSPDPSKYLAKLASGLSRMPHGEFLAGAELATLLALYGRPREAEDALSRIPKGDAPPLLRAMEPRGRAFIAYTEGHYREGLAFAEAALGQSTSNGNFPGSRMSALANQSCRNLGLALLGEETPSTIAELREARLRLPLVAKLIAAWGLAAAAKRCGDTAEFEAERQFIASTAPHFTPVLESLDGSHAN